MSNYVPSRKTIRKPVRVPGIGLHSGMLCSVPLEPASAGTGLMVNGSSLTIDAIESSTLATTVRTPLGPVGTVEHLLAALYGAGIDDVHLSVEGGEIPALDGTAGAWRPHFEATDSFPREEVEPFTIENVIEIRDGKRLIRAEPARSLTIKVDVEFPRLGAFSFEESANRWENAATARTFGFFSQREALQQRGLARGASLENTLVFDDHGEALNEGGLRTPDEIARHKWIDCLGDLALLGRRLCAHVTAVRAGHHLHHALVRRILEDA